jgi:hypothetical protein
MAILQKKPCGWLGRWWGAAWASWAVAERKGREGEMGYGPGERERFLPLFFPFSIFLIFISLFKTNLRYVMNLV